MTTDFYKTLGVSETASPDEIKKAYRKLANQHHPDKGGDQAKFKDISVAYETLSDAQKKAEYDAQRNNPMGGNQFHFNTGGFDPFGHMFGQGFGANNPFGDIFTHMRGGNQGRRNRDLNIQCSISFVESFFGKQLEANYTLPSGRNQNVVINLPAGVQPGDTIRYQGLGDDSIPNMPRGNLNVTVNIAPDPNYERRGDDLYVRVHVSPIEAMIGCKKKVKTLSGEEMNLDIRAGVESGVEFASGGNGFPNVNNGRRGRFVSVVQIKTPTITDQSLIDRLKQLDAEISKNT
jgi:curved DNA-binding protein